MISKIDQHIFIQILMNITQNGQNGMIIHTTPIRYQNSILELKHLTGVVLLVNHTHGPGKNIIQGPSG